MNWHSRYRLHHYVENSIWVWPTLSMLGALVVVPLLVRIDQQLEWHSRLDPSTVQSLLASLASSMFTFIVFVSSALLVAVQLASSQLSPRIIGLVFRDPITRRSLVVFVFTFTVSLAVLVRSHETVPTVTTHFAAYSCLASLACFLFLIDHVGKALRPSGALAAVGRLGREVIESVYPRLLNSASPATKSGVTTENHDLVSSRTLASEMQGVVLACDIGGLVAHARRHDCVIELVPQVGDFLVVGDPLFRIYPSEASVRDLEIRRSVAVGQERTLEQDPAFAFRILVDVASKGLSPAINDPTTAVLAIDQIHYLLREVGRRHLDDERVRDSAGRTRLILRTPSWEDFVQLAVTEIRQFGGTSIQIARRLRAMLENLIETLPPSRKAILCKELTLLRRSAERFFADAEDRVLADVSDLQGVGGQRGASASEAGSSGDAST